VAAGSAEAGEERIDEGRRVQPEPQCLVLAEGGLAAGLAAGQSFLCTRQQ
jgi:hypothetical protein